MHYEITCPQFAKTLMNLKTILGKAEAYATTKKIQPEVLLQSRLAADQFPLLRQIQIACDTAKLGVARLTTKTPPVNDDKEMTIADAKARIESTVQFLNSIKASDFAGCDDRMVTSPHWKGRTMLGKDFLAQHLLPNFYFHVTTAYSILRHNGVEIGKNDYLGELPFKGEKTLS